MTYSLNKFSNNQHTPFLGTGKKPWYELAEPQNTFSGTWVELDYALSLGAPSPSAPESLRGYMQNTLECSDADWASDASVVIARVSLNSRYSFYF
jgi:hypothetical protein